MRSHLLPFFLCRPGTQGSGISCEAFVRQVQSLASLSGVVHKLTGNPVAISAGVSGLVPEKSVELMHGQLPKVFADHGGHRNREMAAVSVF